MEQIESQVGLDRKTEMTIAIRKPIQAAHPSAANHTGHQGNGGELPQGMLGSFQSGLLAVRPPSFRACSTTDCDITTSVFPSSYGISMCTGDFDRSRDIRRDAHDGLMSTRRQVAGQLRLDIGHVGDIGF